MFGKRTGGTRRKIEGQMRKFQAKVNIGYASTYLVRGHLPWLVRGRLVGKIPDPGPILDPSIILVQSQLRKTANKTLSLRSHYWFCSSVLQNWYPIAEFPMCSRRRAIHSSLKWVTPFHAECSYNFVCRYSKTLAVWKKILVRSRLTRPWCHNAVTQSLSCRTKNCDKSYVNCKCLKVCFAVSSIYRKMEIYIHLS